jgi:hypothetical protein
MCLCKYNDYPESKEKMPIAEPTQYVTRWRVVLASIDKWNETLSANHEDAKKATDLARTALVIRIIEQLVENWPLVYG